MNDLLAYPEDSGADHEMGPEGGPGEEAASFRAPPKSEGFLGGASEAAPNKEGKKTSLRQKLPEAF